MPRAFLQDGFVTGDKNGTEPDYLVDFAYLDFEQQMALERFLTRYRAGELQEGKNKPSFEDDDGGVLSFAKEYQTFHVWHYHCGPWRLHGAFQFTLAHLPRNLAGKRCGPVIHYVRRQSGQEITVIGLGYDHVDPFPRPTKASELWQRMKNHQTRVALE
ncbi:hypothetical protein JCM19000A_42390 [Silvimonas sp. JCM 19000]